MIEITYQIHFKTPAHIGTGYGFAGFLDSVVVRDGSDTVYLPGSSIKGKTRAAARRLAHGLGLAVCPVGIPCRLTTSEPCPVCRIFGSPHFPGGLHFDNVSLPDDYRRLLKTLREMDELGARQATTERRTYVMLSRRRRSARPDHLFSHELLRADVPLHGKIQGEIIGRVGQAAPAIAEDIVLLRGSLELITHLGRARARGLGWCEVEVESMRVAGLPVVDHDFQQGLVAFQGGSGS